MADRDVIKTTCRFCGRSVALVYAGQYRQGSAWYMRFRPVDNQGELDQRAHVCPRSWSIVDTRRREGRRGHGGKPYSLMARYAETAEA